MCIVTWTPVSSCLDSSCGSYRKFRSCVTKIFGRQWSVCFCKYVTHFVTFFLGDVYPGLVLLLYTCKLFLRYRRESAGIFEDDTIISEGSPSPKSSEDVRTLDAYKSELAPRAFHFKNRRSRGRYCHLFILHMVFVPYMGLS